MAGEPGDVPPDDLEIPGDWLVLRRIPPGEYKSDGRPKSSPSFDLDRTGRGTSMTLYIDAEDLTNVRRGHETFGVVSLPVSVWRCEGLTIARKPLENDPNHCEIWGARNTRSKKLLAIAAKWEWYSEGHPNQPEGGAAR